MQTRRDQLQAYRYLVRRIMTSLLGSEPEAPEQPMKRVVASTMAGIMVCLVAGGIVALVTWLGGGGAQSWRDHGAYVVEKETGARYLNIQETLHPVENYTSARLIIQGEVEVQRASRDELADSEVGHRMGIPGAPETLPDQENVTSAPWTVCHDQVGVGREAESRVAITVGEDRAEFGGDDLGGDAVVTEAPDGQLYLLWNGLRFPTNETSLTNLGISIGTVVPVSDTWLNAVPHGSELEAMTIPDRGADWGSIGSQQVRVGDVLSTDRSTYFVVLDDGLAEITETESILLQAETSADSHDVSTADIETPMEDGPSSADLPPSPPPDAPLSDGEQTSLCLWYGDDGQGDEMDLILGASVPEDGGDSEGAPADDSGDDSGDGNTDGQESDAQPADVIRVPQGEIAVVGEHVGADQDPSGFFLITDAGVRFPVPSTEALTMLGYDRDPVPVPGTVLDLIPTGPSLNPDDAEDPDSLTSATDN